MGGSDGRGPGYTAGIETTLLGGLRELFYDWKEKSLLAAVRLKIPVQPGLILAPMLYNGRFCPQCC